MLISLVSCAVYVEWMGSNSNCEGILIDFHIYVMKKVVHI